MTDDRLSRVCQSVRGLIAAEAHPDAEVATEIALDLCLYALDGFKLDLTIPAPPKQDGPAATRD
jgi:hypothetical protein